MFTFYIANYNILQKNRHSEEVQRVSLNVPYLICTYYIELNNLHKYISQGLLKKLST